METNIASGNSLQAAVTLLCLSLPVLFLASTVVVTCWIENASLSTDKRLRCLTPLKLPLGGAKDDAHPICLTHIICIILIVSTY